MLLNHVTVNTKSHATGMQIKQKMMNITAKETKRRDEKQMYSPMDMILVLISQVW